MPVSETSKTVFEPWVLSATAWDLFENPQLTAKALEEFQKANRSGYVCLIPPDAVPVIAG